MTQLSNDCFSGADALMPLDEALAMLEDRIAPVTGNETVPLDRADGRILARDLIAPENLPPHDNSAVDGYALYHGDLDTESDTRLPVVGRLAAGPAPGLAARRGTAMRVFTGAMLPPGLDSVAMQEDCRVEGETVVIPPGLPKGANRRAAGEDVAACAVALSAGRRLRSTDIGMAAALGVAELPVRTRLAVSLFSTGDELCEPGAARRDGQIYDANRYLIAAGLRRLGCRVIDGGILPDTAAAVTGALAEAAAGSDMVITSGGVSVGEEDHVKQAVETLGRLHVWRLAIKPGRPVALGQIDHDGRAVPFIGLPGNPAAVVVTFMRFARPLILLLSGCDAIAPRHYRVTAGFDHRKKIGRREFVRCRLESEADGGLVAHKAGRQGAGVLSAVVAAHGLVELPEEMTYLRPGDGVDFLPFNEVG